MTSQRRFLGLNKSAKCLHQAIVVIKPWIGYLKTPPADSASQGASPSSIPPSMVQALVRFGMASTREDAVRAGSSAVDGQNPGPSTLGPSGAL